MIKANEPSTVRGEPVTVGSGQTTRPPPARPCCRCLV